MEERPLGSYAALSATFALAVGAFMAANRDRIGALPAGDVARIAVATHKVSRVVARDRVASFVRAPVTRDDDASEPKPRGIARALGELFTCPYCLDLWLAAAFSAANIVWPRPTRFVTSILAAHAGADFLQAAFARVRA